MADMSIRYLKGVGEKKAKYFEKLDVKTVGDLLRLYPRRYENLSEITDIARLCEYRGRKASVIARVIRPPKETKLRGGVVLTTVYVEDLSGVLRIIYFNNKYIKNSLSVDKAYLFYGKIPSLGEATFTNPEHYPPETAVKCGMLPVYPLVSGLSQSFMRKTVALALESAEKTDRLPQFVLEKYGLCSFREAIYGIHNPKTEQTLALAKKRLIFEELLYYSLGLRMLRSREKKESRFKVTEFPTEFLGLHAFQPTDAQKRALADIYADLSGGFSMNRLLQGDVGSGKTLVAGQAAYVMIKSGAQAAIMVPTEVLANQHYRYFEEKFSALGLRPALLTSSVPTAKKREIKTAVKAGAVDLVIGTHAVIQKDVEFCNLGLVITDEQHRFGVMQRAGLAEKGDGGVHVLVMSATPIPRTLALMLWGDLDLSVIDVMPQGRQKVSTYLVDGSFEKRLTAFIKKNIDEGGRVYVVCPMIEDDEEQGGGSIAAAKDRYKKLCEVFGEQDCALVHGKQKAADKDSAMTAFASGEKKILVSTTVIEVGVNVPEATLMIIENAERFGLSQLHQLRGRVGRGDKKSYCVLVSESESERLAFFTRTTDGFKIASKDLELRGPGNFFGRDQHGLPQMQIASMTEDMEVVRLAAQAAGEILEADSELEAYPDVKERVRELFELRGEIFN